MANYRVSIGAGSRTSPPAKMNGTAKDTAPPPSPRSFSGFSEITSFIWSVADLLRGEYKQSDYGKVILPLMVLRRLDCVHDKIEEKVLAKHAKELRKFGEANLVGVPPLMDESSDADNG